MEIEFDYDLLDGSQVTVFFDVVGYRIQDLDISDLSVYCESSQAWLSIEELERTDQKAIWDLAYQRLQDDAFNIVHENRLARSEHISESLEER